VSQVLLGVRNLSLRIAVFVALAAALAWFLGGSLFARPSVVVLATASTGTASGEVSVRLEQVTFPASALPSDPIVLRVAIGDPGALGKGVTWTNCTTQDRLAEATGLLVADPGGTSRAVWYAGETLASGGGRTGKWRVYRVAPYASCPETLLEVADRLEAERQLARVMAGLPLQSADVAGAARDAVLRAGDASTP
jgi:hypothetical protein